MRCRIVVEVVTRCIELFHFHLLNTVPLETDSLVRGYIFQEKSVSRDYIPEYVFSLVHIKII